MQATLSNRLNALAREASLADGTPCRTISAMDVTDLAEWSGIGGRRVEIAALRENILPDRYLRNMQTLSAADQARLLESTVCIVGLGGLGGLVTETLARLGIGGFKLVDGDVFEAHNLNRQLFSITEGIGRLKADAAATRLRSINPGLELITVPEFLSPENADRIVTQCNLVVDCLDNIQSRFVLEAAAKRLGIPLVSAAIAGMSGHVTTIYPEDKGLENIYGPVEQLTTTKGAETRLGCLAPGVNLIASLECAEAVKVLLEKGNALRNGLLVVDLTDYTFETLQLS